MNQNINFNSQFPVLNTINQVDGFDPSKLTVDYVDLTTQEKRKRLPVMAQLAWFRLRHPEGKIALHVEPVKDTSLQLREYMSATRIQQIATCLKPPLPANMIR